MLVPGEKQVSPAAAVVLSATMWRFAPAWLATESGDPHSGPALASAGEGEPGRALRLRLRCDQQRPSAIGPPRRPQPVASSTPSRSRRAWAPVVNGSDVESVAPPRERSSRDRGGPGRRCSLRCGAVARGDRGARVGEDAAVGVTERVRAADSRMDARAGASAMRSSTPPVLRAASVNESSAPARAPASPGAVLVTPARGRVRPGPVGVRAWPVRRIRL
jgi:hypothetical protein